MIEIEGPAGAGKSTLIRALTAAPVAGWSCVDVAAVEARHREPCWQVGEFMRGLRTSLDPLDAALLYCARTAGRGQLIRRLAHGRRTLLLADRLRLSLYAQLRGTGVAADLAGHLVRLLTGEHRPRLTVLLDVSYAEHRRRLAMRGDPPAPRRTFAALRRSLHEAYGRLDVAGAIIDTTELTAEQVRGEITGLLAAL